jgi:hypothetical protein
MITDPTALLEVQNAWEFVRETRNEIVGNSNVASFVVGFNQRRMRDICFNLLLASAFSTLEYALRQLRDEGRFTGKDNRLGSLMSNSRTSLPWSDYVLVDVARNERNLSVHNRAYLPNANCRDYIAAIECELFAWGILMSMTPQLWHW